jgi:hypothetical protein
LTSLIDKSRRRDRTGSLRLHIPFVTWVSFGPITRTTARLHTSLLLCLLTMAADEAFESSMLNKKAKAAQ